MKQFLCMATIALAWPLQAQIAHGGHPLDWGGAAPHGNHLPEVALPALDRAALIANEVPAVPDGIAYGTQRFIAIDVPTQGDWITTPDDRRICRLVLRSPGAVMLSVQFDRFDLPSDAVLYLYNEDRTYFLGGFNEQNELPDGTLATAVVPGDALVIELQERDPSPVPSDLHIASITHGYRDIFHFGDQGLLRDYDPGYQSAPCHNNVICPVASAWQQQKRAVAMFLRPDGNGCTGQLVNNANNDGTPYFYAANHCYTANENQWVFYFNYESPTCVGNTGPTTQTITGSTLKANYYFDDFLLLQLSSTPPAAYQPFYGGWDHSGSTPTTGTVIGHPLYDVKKITFDNNAATSYSVVPYTGAPETVKCWKSFWDSGIVEAVCSGSALWDQNKRIVGHMFEGAQTCANPASVYTGCAKFSESWDGTSASTRLRDWLDPTNTHTTLDGYDPYATPAPGVLVKCRVFLEGPFDGSTLMNGTLRASGLVPTTEPYTALGYTHAGGGGGEVTTGTVLSGSGSNSIVDWVVVELRDKNNSATVLASRSALLQRDGDVVDVNGTSDVSFNVLPDDYYIAIRHRNHLGAMTQNAQALSMTATLKDFSLAAGVALYGGSAAVKTIATKQCLYAGDATRNGQLKYTNSGNDRDPILSRIGGVVPTNTVNGYYAEDFNMDGVVKYSGTGNDRDMLLVNIGGSVPTSTLDQQLP